MFGSTTRSPLSPLEEKSRYTPDMAPESRDVWEKPSVEEIRMDAEIGSYQADDDQPYFVVRHRDE
jgi:hypothetical protein